MKPYNSDQLTLYMANIKTKQSLPKLIPYRKGNKWGYSDKNGDIVIECIYDFAGFFYEGQAEVILNRKCGIINEDGTFAVTPIYDSFDEEWDWHLPIVRVTKNNFIGLIERKGREILSPEYMKIVLLGQNNFYGVKQSQYKWGFFHVRTGYLSPFMYNYIGEPTLHDCINVKSWGRWGVVDLNNTFVIPPKYAYELKFTKSGLSFAIIDESIGIIDSIGRIILPIKYKWRRRSDDYFQWRSDGRVGVIDIKGHVLFEGEYDDLHYQRDGYIKVQKNGKWGLIKYGEIIFKPMFDSIGDILNSSVVVKQDQKWGCVDFHGRAIITFEYDGLSTLRWVNEKTADLNWLVANKNSYYGVINLSKEIIIPIEYDYFNIAEFIRNAASFDYKFEHILSLLSQFEKFGIIDKDEIRVSKNRKWGLIDFSGTTRVPLKYEYLGTEGNSLYRADLNGKRGYIDNIGTEYWED